MLPFRHRVRNDLLHNKLHLAQHGATARLGIGAGCIEGLHLREKRLICGVEGGGGLILNKRGGVCDVIRFLPIVESTQLLQVLLENLAILLVQLRDRCARGSDGFTEGR